MRRAKTIKRRNIYFLNALILTSSLVFYEMHSGVFLKEVTERRLESLLPEGARVDIGSMKGGIFGDLVSEGISIVPGKDAYELNIGKIETDYRLWYAFFKKKRDLWARLSFTENTKDFKIEEKGGVFSIYGEIDHAKFRGADVVCKVDGEIDTRKPDLVEGRISFKGIIVEYEPLGRDLEILFSYDRAKDTLNITKFVVNRDMEGYGHVRLGYPHNVFLKLAVTDLALEDYFKTGKFKGSVSGTMNGNIALKGPIKEARLSAHFDVQSGRLGDMKFDSIIANLKGEGPVISLYDSRIRKEGGYIILSGEIDLSELKTRQAFDDVLFGPDENFFVWEGWSVTKEYDDSSVKAEKPLDEDINVSFKARSEDETAEEEHFLGVEHKVKF